jgi:hypothetical protein
VLGLDELDDAAELVALLAAPARSVFAAEVAA